MTADWNVPVVTTVQKISDCMRHENFRDIPLFSETYFVSTGYKIFNKVSERKQNTISYV